MKLLFSKFNPSGNTTVLIDNRHGDVKQDKYAPLAAELMVKKKLSAEQVGYWEESAREGAVACLHMMGGEFCGNATRCMAKLLCDRDIVGIQWNQAHTSCQVPVEVFGYPELLCIKVTEYARESAQVFGAMPLPLKVEAVKLTDIDIPMTGVYFDGIVHVILKGIPFSKELTQKILDGIYGKENPPEAVGVLFYEPNKGYMKPAVYVKEVDSLVYESSCGSGSVAIAAMLYEENHENIRNLPVQQPGGTVIVSFGKEEHGFFAEIGGKVNIECEGTVWVPDTYSL